MKGYTKVFKKILLSSIWKEDVTTRIMWITLLVLADEDGIVPTHDVDMLAAQARIDPKSAQKALKIFQEPDPSTLTQENEGRRVKVVPEGLLILNHGKYREMMSLEQRRAYKARKAREYRQQAKELQKEQEARGL